MFENTEKRIVTGKQVIERNALPQDPHEEMVEFHPPIKIQMEGAPEYEFVCGHKRHIKTYTKSELSVRAWFIENVKPDWTILDIGANVGQYAVLLGKLIETGMVYSFEPTQTAALLRQNVVHNGLADKVKIVPQAMGKEVGEKKDKIFRNLGL